MNKNKPQNHRISLENVYTKKVGATNLAIREVNLPEDIEIIYRWTQLAYAKKFWAEDRSLRDLYSFYHSVINNCCLQLFFVTIDRHPAALVEVYPVQCAEEALQNAYEVRVGDYGIHLLLSPHRELLSLASNLGKKNISVFLLQFILEFMFNLFSVQRILAEPDVNNTNAGKLANRAGFVFQRIIQLSNKVAALYIITRQDLAKAVK
ncbi:GNAT family N-acetyltransferase [Niabella sp. CJ426]|uniref:GNAT family N-acetyltransferase n=1 Tax=Niabella sp. CJ426 TaxID=3393740 RepID=UPI003D015101